MKHKLQERVKVEYLRENFQYNPVTGYVFRLKKIRGFDGKDIVGGKHVLSGVNSKGYMTAKVLGKAYPLHQIAWYMHYGSMPERPMEIDHINRIKTDNRICNLRATTKRMNNKNKNFKPKHGELGITWRKDVKRFVVKRRVNGKTVHAGFFEKHQLDEAKKAARSLDKKTRHIV